MIEIFIRKAGFWNAKTFKFTSQFGHIMIKVGGVFFSFNLNRYLPKGTIGCVQKVSQEGFCQEYKDQIWWRTELDLPNEKKRKIISYFTGSARFNPYSIKNNCTVNCQKSLEVVGINFPRYFLFPGGVFGFLRRNRNNLPIKNIERVII